MHPRSRLVALALPVATLLAMAGVARFAARRMNETLAAIARDPGRESR